MVTYKSLFSYSCLSYLLLLSVIFSFYFFNPFSNKCIQGNCENGKGVYVLHSGMKYDGEWKNGMRNGQGTLTYPDGSTYTGEWKNNKMHGQGIKIYTADQLFKKYIGDWNNGNKHGKGTAIYVDGSLYEGEWQNGQINGQGTITTTEGGKIIGKRKDEILYGTSTEIFPNGRILVVERKNGLRQGRGTLTYPDGTKIIGEWINNKLVGSLNFYLFRVSEFEEHYDITQLCSAIKEDISISLNANENTVAWLNELLKIPNLYEKFNKKIEVARLSQEINTLIEHTKDLHNKRFSELDNDSQRDIVKLNRLLLEHFYPGKTPKS